MTEAKRELSAREAADLAGVCVSYIKRLCKDGVLPSRKLAGRYWIINRRDLLEWNARRKVRRTR